MSYRDFGGRRFVTSYDPLRVTYQRTFTCRRTSGLTPAQHAAFGATQHADGTCDCSTDSHRAPYTGQRERIAVVDDAFPGYSTFASQLCSIGESALLLRSVNKVSLARKSDGTER